MTVRSNTSRSTGKSESFHPFVSAIAALKFVDCFNPYSDRCMVHDHPEAPMRRASALSAILTRAVAESVDEIWIGRDLGYRGGRRTGLALTDDVHTTTHANRWSIEVTRPTIGESVAERTAAVIWNMLDQIDAKVFLWNVFPLHPHEVDNPFSNRQHNALERRAGEEILVWLIDLLGPKRLIAIGNDAAKSATKIAGQIPVINVRHPSYGGQTQFVRQITGLHCLRSPTLI